MKLRQKLAALDQIYEIYDNFISGMESACRKNCAHCCTTSVMLTTVEGYKMAAELKLKAATAWIDKIQQASAQKRFRPKVTTNQLANMCAEGIEPPAENPAGGGACPFLNDSQCPIYAARPLACRCLVSLHDCGKGGYADMDDFVLSVNTVFLQTVEHMDADGCCGNMLDVLGVMAVAENRQAYEDNGLKCSRVGLITNQPIKVLMIPPEHLTRMQPMLKSLKEIRI
jgi:Fe-S-cluster containining protein